MLPLPKQLESVLHPVFTALPLQEAMPRLCGASPAQPHVLAAVEQAVHTPAFRQRPEIPAGLWLYVDDFARAHQTLDRSPTGAFWQAILFRREGKYEHALHAYERADRHPAMESINLSGGQAGAGTDVARFDPVEFVNRARRHARDSQPPADLLALQHREWTALFQWCAENH